MKIPRILLVVFLLTLLGGPLAAPAPARASGSVSVGFFYDSLEPYGQWVVSASFGTVWRPARVSAGWRPYYDGQWVWTDYGWTFVSDEPWGWATYHYGRWYFDPMYGWIWIPGDDWGPAWVTFYSGPGWIGWAPLPPAVSVRVGVPLRLDPRSYCFVDERRFLEPRVGRWVAPSSRNVTYVRGSRVLARPVREGNRWLARGPSPTRLSAVTRQHVPMLRVVDNPDPRRGLRPVVRGSEVRLYRPQPRMQRGRPVDTGRGPAMRESSRPVPQQQLRPAPRAHDSRSVPPPRSPRKSGKGNGRH
jgi:hypothetical protein